MLTDVDTLSSCSRFSDSVVCFTGQKTQPRGRGTYTAGTVNSVLLLKVGRKNVDFPSHFWWPDVPKMCRIAQICTCLRDNLYCVGGDVKPCSIQSCTYIFQIFPGVAPPSARNWEGLSPLPDSSPQWAPTVPLFQSFCGRWLNQQHQSTEGSYYYWCHNYNSLFKFL